MIRSVWVSRRRAPRSGAALVEFALTVPFLLMMTMGVVDFSRYLNTWNVAETVARDGCRYGATITNNLGGSWYTQYPQISAHDDTRITVTNSTIE